jgi:Ni/Co efflux regulator RcnB
MKKLVSILAVAAFMLSMNVNAQEPKQKTKKEKAKTEKSCSTEEKKSCSTDAKAGGCCASKKAATKKAE